MTYNITFPVQAMEGPLTKACHLLGASGNPMLGARLAQQVFEGMFTPEANSTPETCILIFGEQPAPFPPPAVIKPQNNIIVLHGIKRLGIAFGVKHPNKGHTLAFVNNADPDSELPIILKLTPHDFADTQAWFCPELCTIMNTDTTCTTVLPVPEGDCIINTAKVIPILLFLVPLFINGGQPQNAMAMVQAFYNEFYTPAPVDMQQQMQYIFNFLCAAAGFDVSNTTTPVPPSQLALDTEDLTWDLILYQWALNRFGGIIQIACHTNSTDMAPIATPTNTQQKDKNTTIATNTTPGQPVTNTMHNHNQNTHFTNHNIAPTITAYTGPTTHNNAHQQAQLNPFGGMQGEQHGNCHPNITTQNQNMNTNIPALAGTQHITAPMGHQQCTNFQQLPDTIDLTLDRQNVTNHVTQNTQPHLYNDTNTNIPNQTPTNNTNTYNGPNNYLGTNYFTNTNSFPTTMAMGSTPMVRTPHQLPSPPGGHQSMNQPPENYPQTPQNLEDIPNLRLLNYAQLLPAPWGGWHTHTTPHTPVLNWFQQWGYLPLPTAHPYGLPNLPQRPPTQIDPNIASIISGMFQAALTTMQQQGTNNTTGGLQTGGKSTKILQGTNRYSLLGLCSLTIQDDVPKIIRIFDSNKDTTAKCQALKDLLLMAQNDNAFVNFTLQKETFKDLKQHQFHFDHDEKNMTHWFSPFCLQKMDKGSKIALCQLEEHME